MPKSHNRRCRGLRRPRQPPGGMDGGGAVGPPEWTEPGAGEVGGEEASVANRPVVFARAPPADAAPGHQGIRMATAPTTGDAPPTTGDAPPTVPARSDMRARVARAVRRAARAALRAAWAALRAAWAALRTAWAARPKRRIRLIDLLRVLGLARRAVPRAVVGPKAYPQWWQRLLALGALIALVAVIGFALAVAVGLMVVVAGFLLEQAIS